VENIGESELRQVSQCIIWACWSRRFFFSELMDFFSEVLPSKHVYGVHLKSTGSGAPAM
jgi:hypothetical protein